MDFFGIMAFIILTWAWSWPEAVGRWIAKVKHGMIEKDKDDD
jgi:hypothetical protein